MRIFAFVLSFLALAGFSITFIVSLLFSGLLFDQLKPRGVSAAVYRYLTYAALSILALSDNFPNANWYCLVVSGFLRIAVLFHPFHLFCVCFQSEVDYGQSLIMVLLDRHLRHIIIWAI